MTDPHARLPVSPTRWLARVVLAVVLAMLADAAIVFAYPWLVYHGVLG